MDWIVPELFPDLLNVCNVGFTEHLDQFQELHWGVVMDHLDVVVDKVVQEFHNLAIESKMVQVVKHIHMK